MDTKVLSICSKIIQEVNLLISIINVVKKRTAFMVACRKGQLKVKRLLYHCSESKSIDLKKRGLYGCTALMFACEYGQMKCVYQFIISFR